MDVATSTAEFYVGALGLSSLGLQLVFFAFAFGVGLKVWPARKAS